MESRDSICVREVRTLGCASQCGVSLASDVDDIGNYTRPGDGTSSASSLGASFGLLAFIAYFF